VTPPTCEYKCGKWCSNPLPDWNDNKSCLIAWSECALQTASCFLHAGFPDSLQCFEFGDWCGKVASYCGSKCTGGTCGGKDDCYKSSPPKGGNPPVTHTSTVPCPTTSTKTTTAGYPTATPSCPPSPTGICIQPTNKLYGYGPGSPVGGIPLPIVSCNNLKADFTVGNIFKLYTNQDSRNCPAYTRPQVNFACLDACEAQQQQCEGVYAEGCRSNIASSRFGQSWNDADAACKAQYGDCVTANKYLEDTKHCSSWTGC
jgi:hypothetical protein